MPPLPPPPSPPEPPEPPSLYCTPSQSRATTPSPLAHKTPLNSKPSPLIKKSKQAILTPEFTYEHITPKTIHKLSLKRHRHTNPVIWCSAIICLIFSLLIIFFGIATLTIFLVVKPRTPVFDITHATLNAIYFDSLEHFNGDLTFLANFSNPNKKLHVKYEHLVLELYFDNNLISSQTIRTFSQRPRETGVLNVHFISSLVYLPLNHAMELQKQVLSNKVMYSVRGTFQVKVSFGVIHYSYWLRGRCELQMSSPPSGFLMARSCKTKK